MALLLFAPLLLTSLCSAKPVGTRVADVPLSASESVANFTWTDETQPTTVTLTLPVPEERRAAPTLPRHYHHPLDIYKLAKATEELDHAIHGNEFIANPKHQIEHPPLKTPIHHEPVSIDKERAQFTAKQHHVAPPVKRSFPTELALLHEAAILHERQEDVSTFTFTAPKITATFTFTSPTGTGANAFSDFTTFTDATGFPFQRRAATTVTATWDGITTTMTFSDVPTDLPFTFDERAVTTPAPTPSAFPIHAPVNCAQACDEADVSCSSLLTSYTANTMW